MTVVTRRYQFSASHRLHCPELSSDENQSLFGKCNNPYGHGHDYVLHVSVMGSVDPVNGLLVRAAELDRLVQSTVLRSMSSRYLNLDVPPFDLVVPTTENVVLVIRDLLLQHWSEYVRSGDCRLQEIEVRETDRNTFSVLANAPDRVSYPQTEEANVYA